MLNIKLKVFGVLALGVFLLALPAGAFAEETEPNTVSDGPGPVQDANNGPSSNGTGTDINAGISGIGTVQEAADGNSSAAESPVVSLEAGQDTNEGAQQAQDSNAFQGNNDANGHVPQVQDGNVAQDNNSAGINDLNAFVQSAIDDINKLIDDINSAVNGIIEDIAEKMDEMVAPPDENSATGAPALTESMVNIGGIMARCFGILCAGLNPVSEKGFAIVDGKLVELGTGGDENSVQDANAQATDLNASAIDANSPINSETPANTQDGNAGGQTGGIQDLNASNVIAQDENSQVIPGDANAQGTAGLAGSVGDQNIVIDVNVQVLPGEEGGQQDTNVSAGTVG